MPEWTAVVGVVVVAVPLMALRVRMRHDAMDSRMEWGDGGTPVPNAAMRRHLLTQRVLGGVMAAVGGGFLAAGEVAGLLVVAVAAVLVGVTLVLPHLATARLRRESRPGTEVA